MADVFDLKKTFESELARLGWGWDVKGVIDSQKRIYTLGSDTKLLSTVLELVIKPIILEIGESHNFEVIPSDRQTVYPDFTLKFKDGTKVALDVKSTYRQASGRIAGFTLGSYVGYLRNPTKNIMFPYDEYSAHWIMGFIYSRELAAQEDIVQLSDLETIQPAIKDIEIILQEKYQIASDRPGSGNTANIGSITDLEKLKNGDGPFATHGERVFEDYWRNFVSAKTARDQGIAQPFRNLAEYLAKTK